MKVFTGKVISKKMTSTATVNVDSTRVHKLYGKIYKKTKRYHVHDTLNSEVGDVVKFVACKPYSKLKRWKIIETVGKTGGKTEATPKAISVNKKIRGSKKIERKIRK